MATAPLTETPPAVHFVRTADGYLAARVAHLVMALVPCDDGVMRVRTAFPARDPATCSRACFHPSGFKALDEASFRIEAEDFAAERRAIAALGRREIGREALKGLDTPWDVPDHGVRYAEGVMRVTSPIHGGFVLSRERNDAVDPRWRAECDVNAFYEEDEEWAVVAFTFPELFTDGERRAAEATLIAGRPGEWTAITGRTIPDDRA